MMGPVIDDIRAEYAGKLIVEDYNVRENPEPGDRYRIRMTPTQIVLDAQGKELYRHESFISHDDLVIQLKQLGIVK